MILGNSKLDLITLGPDLRVADLIALGKFLEANFEPTRGVVICGTQHWHHSVVHVRRDERGKVRLWLDGSTQVLS